MWLNKFLVCGFVLAVRASAEQDVQLEIPQGQLRGLRTETIYQGKQYYSFKGIPFAKPNVGSDKFRVPEPAEPWEGVYDATYYRDSCPFYCMIRKGLIGDEDCLYLNVYSPTLDKEARKAVMVWLHPGGWNTGLATDDLFGPDFLVENDVVIVTLNSRLGALGFLNTGDKNAPGNAGLKDQVMALKWVKDNIHYFGGCPNRVTIFGESSGAGSVQYHMMSPMSEGLFTAAIQESGSAFSPWSITYNSRELAFKLGEILGIKTTDSGELVQKLSEFPPEDLIHASQEIMKGENTLSGRTFAFVPSIETDLGQDMFLPDDPWNRLKEGKLADVPLMAGITSEEAAFFARLMIDQIDMVNEQPEMYLPYNRNFTDAAEKKEIGEALKQFYFGDKQASLSSANEYSKMLSDNMFDAGVLLPLEVMSRQHSSPIYEYMFTYNAPFGFMKTLFGMSDIGVAHGDELSYLWHARVFNNKPPPGSDAEKMTHIMTKLWTNFAKDRNPTSEMDDVITETWEPRGTVGNYMIIDIKPKLEQNMLKDRMVFWEELYKELLGN